jgi:hypothetical protein
MSENICICCKREFSNYRSQKLVTAPNNGCAAKNMDCYAKACVICSTLHKTHDTFTEDGVTKCSHCEGVVSLVNSGDCEK